MSRQASATVLQHTSRVTFRDLPTDRPSSHLTSNRSQTTLTSQSKPKSTLRHLKNYQIQQEFREQLKKDASQLWKNQKEIRQMLHPTLCEDFLPEEREMNSKGLLSASKSSFSLTEKRVLNLTPSRSVFSRYQDFNKMPQLSLDVVSFLTMFILYSQ